MKLFRKFKTFNRIVKSVSDKGVDYFTAAVDILYCRWRYKVSLTEYMDYHFYNYQNRYRKNFLLDYHRLRYKTVNTKAFTKSKYVFYTYIPDLYQRELLLAPQCGENAFVEFLKKHQRIVIKPDEGSLGEGIRVICYTDDAAAKTLFASFSQQYPTVCEEFILQHDVLKQLNPSSVNTLRITSLMQNGEVEILSATLKCGAGKDKITDNLSIGGIGAQIDIPTGIVSTFGQDFEKKIYSHHPITGVQIIGMQIPNWDATISLIKEAHKRLPQCKIFGWDVAITETGADIVEANSKPGSRIMQRMDGIPKGQKIIPMLHKHSPKEDLTEYTLEFRARRARLQQKGQTPQ